MFYRVIAHRLHEQDSGANPATPTVTTTTTTEPERASEPGSVEALPKWAQSLIGDLRKESAERRKAVSAAEEQKRKDEEAAAVKQGEWRTVAEKAQAERDAAEAKAAATEVAARERVVRTEIRALATSMGFNDPADAHRFLDLTAVEMDAAGEPKNLQALLDALAKAKPYLVKATTTRTLAPTSAGSTPTASDVLQQDVQATLQTGRYSRF